MTMRFSLQLDELALSLQLQQSLLHGQQSCLDPAIFFSLFQLKSNICCQTPSLGAIHYLAVLISIFYFSGEFATLANCSPRCAQASPVPRYTAVQINNRQSPRARSMCSWVFWGSGRGMLSPPRRWGSKLLEVVPGTGAVGGSGGSTAYSCPGVPATPGWREGESTGGEQFLHRPSLQYSELIIGE